MMGVRTSVIVITYNAVGLDLNTGGSDTSCESRLPFVTTLGRYGEEKLEVDDRADELRERLTGMGIVGGGEVSHSGVTPRQVSAG